MISADAELSGRRAPAGRRVVAQVKSCRAGWCRVIGDGFDGWIEQERLWGVYANEKVELGRVVPGRGPRRPMSWRRLS